MMFDLIEKRLLFCVFLLFATIPLQAQQWPYAGYGGGNMGYYGSSNGGFANNYNGMYNGYGNTGMIPPTPNYNGFQQRRYNYNGGGYMAPYNQNNMVPYNQNIYGMNQFGGGGGGYYPQGYGTAYPQGYGSAYPQTGGYGGAYPYQQMNMFGSGGHQQPPYGMPWSPSPPPTTNNNYGGIAGGQFAGGNFDPFVDKDRFQANGCGWDAISNRCTDVFNLCKGGGCRDFGSTASIHDCRCVPFNLVQKQKKTIASAAVVATA